MTEFRTVIAKRPMPAGDGSREERAGPVAVDWSRMAEVENEDIVHALLRFRNGAVGHFGSSRLAWGRRNGIDIELYGSKGSMRFTQERFNEIDLFLPDADRGSNGFRTILTGPEHPPYGRFSPAGGHGLGFNDLKVAEVAHLMAAIGGEAKAYPDFAEGAAIEEVCDAMVESAASGRWVKVPE
jgi:predicted dehydrogenase